MTAAVHTPDVDASAGRMAAAGLSPLVLRLAPGADLRSSLEAALAGHGANAGFVLAGIGSLRPTKLRMAGAEQALTLDEDAEMLTLSGSVGTDTSHLHLSISLRDGRVLGGHAGYGCVVRTTAEVLLAVLPALDFAREVDPSTGYAELVVHRR